MEKPSDVEYTVVLVCPAYGEERENAEEIIEAALEHLNTQKDEPGFRFAYPVFARLEIVSDAEEAEERLLDDRSVAMMILHGLDDDERIALTRKCLARTVPVCRTTPTPDQPEDPPPPEPSKPRRWEIRLASAPRTTGSRAPTGSWKRP